MKPSTSKLAGLVYRISFEESPELGGAACFGYCDEAAQLIVIDEDLDDDLARFNLCHEVVEQVNMTYGLELDHTQITVLGVALRDWLKNNHCLVDYLRA